MDCICFASTHKTRSIVIGRKANESIYGSFQTEIRYSLHNSLDIKKKNSTQLQNNESYLQTQNNHICFGSVA